VHGLRAFPTLFRVGFAEMVAYRTEFLIWILTTNMPLVMMGLWTAVASEGPVGRFGKDRFVAYYLATLIVRLLTSTWMVWELTMEIRQGTLAARLLRPLHPLLAYLAQHLAAVPLRALITLAADAGTGAGVRAPAHRQRSASSRRAPAVSGRGLADPFLDDGDRRIAGAVRGQRHRRVRDLAGLHFLLSGYLIPLELLPGWVARIANVLPFRYTLSFPVETVIGLHPAGRLLHDLGIQWLYVVALLVTTLAVWRAGMRRFVAFGG